MVTDKFMWYSVHYMVNVLEAGNHFLLLWPCSWIDSVEELSELKPIISLRYSFIYVEKFSMHICSRQEMEIV